jgi:hypothetical protein
MELSGLSDDPCAAAAVTSWAGRGAIAPPLAPRLSRLLDAWNSTWLGRERPRSIERVVVGHSPRSVGHIAASCVSGRMPVCEISSIVVIPSVAGLNVPIKTVRPADPAIGPSPSDVLRPVFP